MRPRIHCAKKSTLPILLITIFWIFWISTCSSDLFNPPKAPEITGLELDRYEVDAGDTVTMTVLVTDSKDPSLHYEWTADNGRFIPPLDKPQVKWKAPVAGGIYTISVKVSNEDKSASRTQNVTVRSFAIPDVKIIEPGDGSHWVQYSTLSVTAHARHENGIARVDLFVNNHLKATLNGHPADGYAFTCDLNEPSGQAVVKIEATANVTGMAGKDSVSISIEGIVQGKTIR